MVLLSLYAKRKNASWTFSDDISCITIKTVGKRRGVGKIIVSRGKYGPITDLRPA